MADQMHPDVYRYAKQIGVDLESTLFPVGYGKTLVTLPVLAKMHGLTIGATYRDADPETARRLLIWLVYKRGLIGIGGGWRRNPSDTSNASRNGWSFHQDQRLADGRVVYMAWDLVQRNDGGLLKRIFSLNGSGADASTLRQLGSVSRIHIAPLWEEMPHERNMTDARIFGVWANIGYPGKKGAESWHMQAIEVDGYHTWVSNGRPAPKIGYRISALDPVAPPLPPPIAPTTFVKERIIMTTLGKLHTVGDLLRDTRLPGDVRQSSGNGSRSFKVGGVNRNNPKLADAAGVNIALEVLQPEGRGYVSVNGVTIAYIQPGAPRTVATRSIPLDADGFMEFTIVSEVAGQEASCHLRVSRIGWHEAG